MKKRFTSLLLVLALCLGLTVSASAAEQTITVGDKTYDTLLSALMSETKADSVTARLDSDVTLTAAVVIGSSDYDGQFKEPATITAKNVTVDLNGHTLTAAKDSAVFQVQKDYTLTIVDNSEAKTGKLVATVENSVVVDEGATYNALPAGETEEKPTEEKPTEETPAAKNPFTDVAEGTYYYEAVLWAVENGITAGKTETTFVPGETCTTAHILTFLWRANGSPEPTIENPFTDVKEGDYFYKAALWAAEKKLVSGTVFTPSAPCTRGQTMLYLYLLAGSPEAELSTFTDVPQDSVYSKAISWAVTQGITTGKTETTFAPDEICTRGHIATFLYRADKATSETAPATETKPAA